MKTAISLPDDVFAEAEALTVALGTSRSSLYTAALREYLARHQPNEVTAALNALYDHSPARIDSDLAHAAASVLEQSDW